MLTEMSTSERTYYSSQIKLCEIGEVGQKKLKSSSIAVVGAGGLGCAALIYLATAGVGQIGIIDQDYVELSNLSRQPLYSFDDIGSAKCEIAQQKLSLLNPHINIQAFKHMITKTNSHQLLQDYDLVIDATDNFESRYVINDICKYLGIPFIYASIHHFYGQISVFNFHESNRHKNFDYRCLYPTAPITPSSCSQIGVISPLPGIIGSIQAIEALKLLLAIGKPLIGKLLTIDALTWEFKIYQFDSFEESSEPPLTISRKQLQEMIHNEMNIRVIDIVTYPMDTLQIPPDQTIVLVCEKGIRSLQMAKILRQRTGNHRIFALEPF